MTLHFSVILLTYNSNFDRIQATLDSIIKQKSAKFEIIIADDASDIAYFEEIKDYLKKKGFNKYKLLRNNSNKGTVKNAYNAIKYCEGEYIKCLGAGDLLYSESTLSEVYTFMKAHMYSSCFGKAIQFSWDETFSELKEEDIFYRPRNIIPYLNGDTKKQIALILYGDRPYGCQMFYEKTYIESIWKEMVENTSVKYCEDIFTIKLALENKSIPFINRYVVKYEVNQGVSKVARKRKNKTVDIDIDSYLDYFETKYKMNKSFCILKSVNDFYLSLDYQPSPLMILRSNPRLFYYQLIGKLFSKKQYKKAEKSNNLV